MTFDCCQLYAEISKLVFKRNQIVKFMMANRTPIRENPQQHDFLATELFSGPSAAIDVR